MLIKLRKPFIYLLFAFFIFLTISLNLSNGEASSNQSNIFLNLFVNIFNFLLPNRDLGLSEINGLNYFIRKFIGHFLLFSIDGLVSFILFKEQKCKYVTITILFGLIFSILCEFFQFLAGGRTFAIKDICLDFFSFIYLPSFIYICFIKKKEAK